MQQFSISEKNCVFRWFVSQNNHLLTTSDLFCYSTNFFTYNIWLGCFLCFNKSSRAAQQTVLLCIYVNNIFCKQLDCFIPALISNAITSLEGAMVKFFIGITSHDTDKYIQIKIWNLFMVRYFQNLPIAKLSKKKTKKRNKIVHKKA